MSVGLDGRQLRRLHRVDRLRALGVINEPTRQQFAQESIGFSHQTACAAAVSRAGNRSLTSALMFIALLDDLNNVLSLSPTPPPHTGRWATINPVKTFKLLGTHAFPAQY